MYHSPHPGDGDDPELAQRGCEGGEVAHLLCQLARPPVGLRRAVEIHLGRCAERLSQRASEQVLAELEACRELGRPVAPLVGGLAYRPGQLRGSVLFLGYA